MYNTHTHTHTQQQQQQQQHDKCKCKKFGCVSVNDLHLHEVYMLYI
jgi:hypothetical protein